MATGKSREEDLTAEEIAAADKSAKEHEQAQAEFAKIKHLLDRKADKDWPTLEERIEALWNSDPIKISEISARIKAIEAKYSGA